jgi:hypothetical protein
VAQVETRRRHRLARKPTRNHATDADHVASVKAGLAERTESEEGHWRAEDYHAEDDCVKIKSAGRTLLYDS